MSSAPDRDDRPVSEGLWDYVCPFRKYLLVAAVVEVTLLSLLGFALVVGVDSDSPSHAILLVDFAVVVPTLLAVTYAYRRCNRRDRI
ncbi:MAG: hypothetical protein ABEJ26_08965 [Halosimplex sp.]